MANLATRIGTEGEGLQVVAPLQRLSKSEIIRLGTTLGVDYSRTRSCYDPASDGRPCLRCDSCQLRLAGFAGAGLVDPLLTRFGLA
jgi:7-cyano-7-deazaguanine synthase